ncbi:MAG: protease pro-enzyme activation domain-containing protein, partial [Solirubrobacteraceae bacterium]
LGTVAAGSVSTAGAAPRPAETVLPGSAAPFTGALADTGLLARSSHLTVQLWMTPRLQSAEILAAAVSSPGNALFHHYVSPAEYATTYGASMTEVSMVEAWLRTQGFTGISTDLSHSYVRATASVGEIDEALRTQIDTYRSSSTVNAGAYVLHANNRAISLPASLAPAVLGVTGLDNASPIQPLIRPSGIVKSTSDGPATEPATPCSGYYGEQTVAGLPAQFGVTRFPTIICGYSGRQMRDAYRATWANTGKGETIALVEEGLTKDMFLTLEDYAKANDLPAPSAAQYEELSLGANSCGDPFDGEEQLDVEASHDMAPGANQLVVGGDSCNNGDEGNQSVFDADIAVLDGDGGHPLATVASNSWESGTEDQPASITNIEHSYLVQAADEGVGMYFSAGDGSGVLEPAIDPFAIGVGGTSLGIGKVGNRLFETGWSTGSSLIKSGKWVLKAEDGASGGGPSVHWAQPGYQVGVVPTSLGKTRVGPDISSSADPFTGMALGQLSFNHKGGPVYSQIPIGGTSESAPLVAGIVAAAQQGQASAFGFINPAIYQLAGSTAFYATLPITTNSPTLDDGVVCNTVIFANLCGNPAHKTLLTFDDQDPHMRFYTGQVTLPGYDDMTGLGTPNGPNFITDLRNLEG